MHCDNCGKQITKKKDANILAFLGVIPKSFCNNCYSSKERGFWRHVFYFPQQPINSEIYRFGMWVLTFCAIGFFAVMAISISLSDSLMKALPFLSVVFLFLFVMVIYPWIMHSIAKKRISKLN